jgi:hypothetical protein
VLTWMNHLLRKFERMTEISLVVSHLARSNNGSPEIRCLKFLV